MTPNDSMTPEAWMALAILVASIPLWVHVFRVDRQDLADRAARRGVYARGPGCVCHPHLACSCGATAASSTTVTTTRSA